MRRVVKYTVAGSLPVFKAETLAQQRGSEYTILQAEPCETSDLHGQVRAGEMLSPVSRWSPFAWSLKLR